MTLYTTRQVADLYGNTPRATAALARRRGIKSAKEEPISGAYLWSEGQLESLRPKPTGRPRRVVKPDRD